MPNDEHVVMLGRGATVWNEWRATHDEMPDLSRAELRGLDLSGANLSSKHLDGANFFKAVLDGGDLTGASLNGAQFLNCAQVVATRNWQSAFRDEELACGASIPDRMPSE